MVWLHRASCYCQKKNPYRTFWLRRNNYFGMSLQDNFNFWHHYLHCWRSQNKNCHVKSDTTEWRRKRKA